MKHFWVFAFVSIIITLFFSGFVFPEKGYAQTTQFNVSSAKTSGDKFFTDQIAKMPGGSSAGITYFIKTLNEAQQKFDSTFTSNPTPAGYKQGLSLAVSYINKQNTAVGSPNEIRRDPLSNLILQFTNTLTLEANKAENQIFSEQLGKTPAEAAQIAQGQVNAAAARAVAAAEVVNDACQNIISTFIPCINKGFTWFVKSIILNIVGFFLWMSANLLNFAMYHGIFEFKKFAPDEIYNIWLVVRQIISLFVFFTGLFVGFMAIIGKSEEFKKYIAFLMVFGLFVNFSYPIVRVFIDVSNVVSLQIYQTTLGSNILISDNPSGDDTAGAKIMKSLGLQGLVMSATSLENQATDSGFLKQTTSLPGALAVVGFVGYAGYIFFMAAILIIVRTALLVCIIIASPILLVDTIVPALGEKAQWLRGMFVSQLFLAPVFTIMLALTLKFLAIFSSVSKMSGYSTTSTLATGASASASSVTVFFNLIIMLVMLHIMLKVTKAVAGGVGETVTKWAGKAGGLGTGLALGAGGATLGFAGRNTIGRFASNMGKKDFGGGVFGNMVKDSFKSMGGAKYDLRNLGATGAIAGTLGITGMGQGAKKSYDDNREEYEKKATERAGEIEDDGERETYLNRKFNQTGAGRFVDKLTGGTATNSKAYDRFIRGDEEAVKQYINSNEEGRKKMREDEKNKKYLQRFSNVDTASTAPNQTVLDDAKKKMSAETKTAFEAKAAKDAAQKTRNESRVASYLTADQATRESMIANAKLSDDKELQKQLAVMEILSQKPVGQLDRPTIIAAGITDTNLVTKIYDADQSRKATMTAQSTATTNAATAQTNATNLYTAQMAAAQAIQNAQNSAVTTAQQTKLALDQMVQGNADIANLLKGIMQTGALSNNTQNQATSITPPPQVTLNAIVNPPGQQTPPQQNNQQSQNTQNQQQAPQPPQQNSQNQQPAQPIQPPQVTPQTVSV